MFTLMGLAPSEVREAVGTYDFTRPAFWAQGQSARGQRSARKHLRRDAGFAPHAVGSLEVESRPVGVGMLKGLTM